MIVICHKCGATKTKPIATCPSCAARPTTDDDVTLSYMLTERFLTWEKLTEAAQLLRKGNTIKLPPEIRTSVLTSIQESINQETSKSKKSKRVLLGWAFVAGLITVLFLIFHPSPHYQWATFINSVPAYEGFLKRFPSSNLVDNAREQIRLLREDAVWEEVNGSRNISALKEYRRVYPDGKHLSAANNQIQMWADNYWEVISKTDSKTEVYDFLREYPETTKRTEASARVIAISDANWEAISKTNSKSEILKFLQDNPYTTKIPEAKKRIVAIADAEWAKIANNRSVREINEFIHKYPESSQKNTAEQRIKELYSDWDWVKEQDSLEHFRRFIANHPRHDQLEWIEKRIIDLEVKEIAAGKYGQLAPANPLHLGGEAVSVRIENNTGYELIVRYSGPDSKKLVIPKGDTQSVSLLPGNYQIAASVSSANVRNYYGEDTMGGGQYSSTFYIQTDYGGFSVPR